MKILQLTKKFPYPPVDGESLAVLNLSRSLARQGAELTLLSMNTFKKFYDGPRWPEALRHYARVEAVPVDNRIRVGGALRALLSGRSYIVSRFVSRAYAEALRALLRGGAFDVVQLETIYLAPYLPLIRELSPAPVVLRAHNVEFEIWERHARQSRNPAKGLYLRLLSRQLRDFELGQLPAFDLLAAITGRDLERFRRLGFRGPGLVLPPGLDAEDYSPEAPVTGLPLRVGFIGALDWMPNQEGVRWLVQRLWPRLRERLPRLELHLAGLNTPGWLRRLSGNGIHVHGEVPDARAFLSECQVLAVPLFSGSGIRIKILEGLALGRVVVATPLALEGIPARHDQEVLIAQSESEWLQALKRLYHDETLRQTLARNARRFLLREFDNQRLARKLLDAYQSLPSRT